MRPLRRRLALVCSLLAVLFLNACGVVAPTPTTTDTPANLLFEYAAKVVCGLQENPEDMRLARGWYVTEINIHNPNDTGVEFRKKLALTFPPEEQRPGEVMVISTDGLRPDEALKVDCLDIRKSVEANIGWPTPYITGFVVIQSRASLDVTAVYTAGGFDRRDSPSIDVEQIQERQKRGPQEELPDLIPVPDPDTGSFCQRQDRSLVVTVLNQGAGAAGPSTTAVDFGSYGVFTLPTPALAPGASMDLLFGIPDGCFDPDCEFRITVDAMNAVSEIDETNNMAGDTCIG